MSEEIIHINRNERANSYEFGKASNRMKIYFSDVEDLKKQLKEIEEAGILSNEDIEGSKGSK